MEKEAKQEPARDSRVAECGRRTRPHREASAERPADWALGAPASQARAVPCPLAATRTPPDQLTLKVGGGVLASRAPVGSSSSVPPEEKPGCKSWPIRDALSHSCLQQAAVGGRTWSSGESWESREGQAERHSPENHTAYTWPLILVLSPEPGEAVPLEMLRLEPE